MARNVEGLDWMFLIMPKLYTGVATQEGTEN